MNEVGETWLHALSYSKHASDTLHRVRKPILLVTYKEQLVEKQKDSI